MTLFSSRNNQDAFEFGSVSDPLTLADRGSFHDFISSPFQSTETGGMIIAFGNFLVLWWMGNFAFPLDHGFDAMMMNKSWWHGDSIRFVSTRASYCNWSSQPRSQWLQWWDSLWRNHSKLKDRAPVSEDNWETRIVYGSLLVRSGHSKFETRNLWSICFRVNIDKVFWKAWARDLDCIREQKGFLRWQALREYTRSTNRNSIGSNRSNSLGTDKKIRVTFLRTQSNDERKELLRSIQNEELSISSSRSMIESISNVEEEVLIADWHIHLRIALCRNNERIATRVQRRNQREESIYSSLDWIAQLNREVRAPFQQSGSDQSTARIGWNSVLDIARGVNNGLEGMSGEKSWSSRMWHEKGGIWATSGDTGFRT